MEYLVLFYPIPGPDRKTPGPRDGRCDRRHVIQYGAAELATHEMLLRAWRGKSPAPRDLLLKLLKLHVRVVTAPLLI